jgi:hypothetical protein
MVDKLRQVTRRSSGPLQSNGLAVAMTVVNSAVESGAVMII